MKLISTIIFSLTLIGCTVPVKQKFPEAPDTLLANPKPLKEVPANASSSQVFEVVIDNYGTYYETVNLLKGWQDWYKLQKKNYDGN